MISPNHRPRFRRISFSKSPKLSPNGFLQNRLMISQNRRHIFFTENHRISVLQITEHVSSKSPTYLATRFLQTAEHFTLNLQDISPISEQPTFFSVLFGEDPVSDLSLHVPRALRSALWVVGYGSLVTPISPTCARAPHSTLWTMGYQGRELNTELIARSLLILPLSPSYFNSYRAAHVPRRFLWRRPSF